MENTNSYDSTADTLKHIRKVSTYLTSAASELIRRAQIHDESKLHSPEKEGFDEHTPKLARLTYGSDEYNQSKAALGEALTHHYANNSHHPEHYINGINDMNLFDIIEMLIDWRASSERHIDGNIYKSIEINAKRFAMSDQLTSIFICTAKKLGW